MGPGVVRRQADLLPGRDLTLVQDALASLPIAPLRLQVAETSPVPALVRAEANKVAETRPGSFVPLTGLQGVGQLMSRFGPQGAGDAVVADRLIGPRRDGLLEESGQPVVEPNVVWVV